MTLLIIFGSIFTYFLMGIILARIITPSRVRWHYTIWRYSSIRGDYRLDKPAVEWYLVHRDQLGSVFAWPLVVPIMLISQYFSDMEDKYDPALIEKKAKEQDDRILELEKELNMS